MIMQNLPFYVPVFFVVTVCVAVWIFYNAARNSNAFLWVAIALITVQSALGIAGFYRVSTMPPRFPLLLLPAFLTIVICFFTKRGRAFLDRADIKTLTLLHIVRIPVELTLYWLFISQAVPELMTFEGRNLDIISGLTAPLVYYFGFVTKQLPKVLIIVWNILCLGLLMNVAFYAVLSSPTPFQQFAFDQPNIAFQRFPFLLLPAFVAPLVFFAHAIALRQLFLPTKSL
jgi:hypothetical protein